MSRTLLVLAASTYQIPAIVAAKKLGYRVVTTDNVPSNPGHALADASYSVDTTDQDGVLGLAKRESISGVIASGTDVAVVTAAFVAERLNIPGPPVAAAKILTDKQRFRAFLAEVGLRCPRAIHIVDDALPEVGLFDSGKWLVKPSCSSGSKGVFIVGTDAEFLSRVAESRSFSIDHTAVLEKFVEGTQHTCEGIVENGKVTLALFTDRDTAVPPHTATTGHRVPSRMPETVQTLARRTIEQVLAQLGVDSGPFDCDFVACADGITLIEITPRLGGNSLSKLFKAALDFDLVSYAVQHACGDAVTLPQQSQPRPAAILILGVQRPGLLTWNELEAEALRGESWVESLLFDLPKGAAVEPFINGRCRVGEALITANNRSDIDSRLLEFKRRLALVAV